MLVYASALLPLVLLYATAGLRRRPVSTAVIASALSVAALIEIVTYLPVLALQLHPVPAPPPTLAETLRQTAWIRFVAFDIAGFAIAFGAGSACAIIYRRRFPYLACAFLGSIAVFLLHLPLLAITPAFATALMSLSVCLCSSMPMMIAVLAVPSAVTESFPPVSP